MKKTLFAILIATAAGCATDNTTQGVALGAGLGALAGGIIGGHGSDALIGAAVGSGIGYVIGNENDKKKAQQMSEQSRPAYVHHETGPFGGTSWRLQDWSPKSGKEDFRGKSFAFSRDGWVTTTTTYGEGRASIETESYRVVGNTLIVNKGDYLINYHFVLQGDQLTVDAANLRAILKRI
ncbi:MAG TPA: YMGG-like glycine zipper-containing protein [Burkholderiales bacterium]|nr:YMGG-like glycine zipper-containing protein [Burkholderiales bacterium]